MSSANRVKLSIIPEINYGVLDPSGDFTEVKFLDESLTGTPLTVESAAIRSDRQKSGQITTGLELSGGYNFELSPDPSFPIVIEQAMMSDLVAPKVHTSTLTISGSGTVLTTLGSFITDGIKDGDMVILAGMDDAENNTLVMVSNVLALTADIVGEELVDGSGTGATATVPSYHDIGTIDKSLSVCKEFLDVADANIRSLTYLGERVSEMSMSFAFGAIVTGAFSFAGNGYDQPTIPITDARTVNGAGDDLPLDASNGFGWVLVNNENADICVESLSFTLSNGLSPQNCIGRLAPSDQIAGSVSLAFNSTIHLGVASWDLFMPAKLSQAPVSIAFFTRDETTLKGYGVVMNRVQLTFPDPASGGQDSTVTLAASGSASYDSGSGNTMRFYIF